MANKIVPVFKILYLVTTLVHLALAAAWVEGLELADTASDVSGFARNFSDTAVFNPVRDEWIFKTSLSDRICVRRLTHKATVFKKASRDAKPEEETKRSRQLVWDTLAMESEENYFSRIPIVKTALPPSGYQVI
ncbi:hypothetical protein BDV59DRAFT_206278 [Aspergillus ambiguus]|uniref:uncharacterized protein n=1 Tax=Aspergillus ambiguus TaxID=176160 RepID=UPI003CCD1FBC